jgi:LacI family transcriptional regulator
MSTIRSIARQLGLSPTAVSLALKGSPRVSATTRHKVAAAAAAAGYVPNAKLAEVMNQVRNSQVSGYHSTLGAFSLFPQEKPWVGTEYYHLQECFAGAVACAASRGYKLDLLWLKAPGMTPDRFRVILEARGIRGLYCLGSWDADEPLPAALAGFAIVAHAASIGTKLHRVASHFAHDCMSLLEQLYDRGYRRIGMVFKSSGERRTDFAYTSTFLGFQDRILTPPYLPILRMEAWHPDPFTQWFQTHRPDALVIHHEGPFIAAMESALSAAGLNCPRDYGIALLDKNPAPARFSGIVQNHQLMGAEAIDLLIGRIYMGDFGLPNIPKFALVEGKWNEGATLRPRP